MKAKEKIKKDISNMNQGDKVLTIFIISYYYIQLINASIKINFSISKSLWSTMSTGFAVLLFAILLFTLPTIFKRSTFSFFFGEVVLGLMVIFSILMGNAEPDILKSIAFKTLCVCFPIGICVYSIKDYNSFIDTVHKSSFLLSIIAILTLMFGVGEKDALTYNMSISYFLMIPILFQLQSYFANHKIIDLLFAIAGTICILLYGARGPLLCIAIYYFISIFNYRKNSVKKFFQIAVIIILIVCVIMFYDDILISLSELLTKLGINSRTIYLLHNNDIFHNSGRGTIYEIYINKIKERPFFGWGYVGGWISEGLYPHNILLELPLCFGIVFGIVCDVAFVTFLVYGLFSVNTKLDSVVCIFAAATVQLFFSGILWSSPEFFIFLLLIIKKYKERTIIKKVANV